MTKAKFKKKVFVFIDVLGFSGLVGKEPETVLKIVDLVDYFSKEVRDLQNPIDSTNEYNTRAAELMKQADIEISYFSDSLVISSSLEGVMILITLTKRVNRSLMDLGFVFRGAIVIGDIYHRGGKVVGKALIDAYFIESQVAIYPRIVLADEVVNEIIKLENNWDSDAHNKPIKNITEDFDGMYIIHPFYQFSYSLNPNPIEVIKMDLERLQLLNLIKDRKRMVEHHLESFKNDIKVRVKIQWLAIKLNEFIKESGLNVSPIILSSRVAV